MFDIEYKGGNSVVITTKKSVLVIDPKGSEVGLKDVIVKDAVELSTEARFALENKSARLTIEGPGEYEVGDFSIKGVAASRHIDADAATHSATIYRIEVGDVRIALLGNIAPKLSEDQLEVLGVVDLLVIPVGGGGLTLDATSACRLVRQIEPKAVIPVHFADNGINYEVPQDSVEVFTKELGVPVEKMAKLKVKNGTSLPDALTVLQLERS